MTKKRIRRIVAQIFLAVAYVAVTLQWLWVLTIGLPPLIETGVFDSFSPPKQVEQPAPGQTAEPSPVLMVVAGVITLVFLAITIIVLIKLPKAISHTGDALVHKATIAVVPVITHHKKLPAKKQRVLSRQITIGVQLTLVAVPLLISFFLPPIQTITSQIISTLAIWLATISVACFVISWLFQPTITSRTQLHESRG